MPQRTEAGSKVHSVLTVVSNQPEGRFAVFNRIRIMAERWGRRRLLAIAAGLISLLLLYAIIGFAVLPGMVKSRAEQLVLSKLHRPLSIQQVDVNPFTLGVRLQGVRLLEPDGNAEFASIERAHLNLSIASLFRMAPVVQQVKLTNPHVRLIRIAGNRYNIDDLVEMALQPAKEPTRFSLHNIQVEGGRIEFDDRPKSAKHVVEDLELGIPFLSSLPSQVDIFVEPLLSAKVNGTQLLLKGKAKPFAQQKEAAVDLQLDGIDLARYMEYLPFEPRFKLPEGRLNVDLTLNFVQPKDQAPALLIEGGASLKSLMLTELDGATLLRLPELNVSAISANLSSRHFRIGKVELVKPEAHLLKETGGGLNFARLMPEPATAKPGAAPENAADNAPDAQVEIDQLQIRDGSASFRDMQSAKDARATAAKMDLTVTKAALDLRKRKIEIEQIISSDAELAMVHGKPEQEQAVSSQVLAASDGKQSATPGYALRIGKVAIQGWSVRVEDQSQEKPAVTLASPVAVMVTELSNASGNKGTFDMQATVNKSGSASVKGIVGLAPARADLEVDMRGVDILAFQPYVADYINLVLRHASLSALGTLQVTQGSDGGLKSRFTGDMSFDDVATVDRVSGNDFLRWKRLAFTGVDAHRAYTGPDASPIPLSFSADQVALSDFFARVIISPAGRINLQDIVREKGNRRISLTQEEAAPDGEAVKVDKAEPNLAAASEEVVPPPASKMPPIRIGKFVMQSGRVRFTDNFIRPNYSATLTNLSGAVSNLSTEAGTAASVDVRGKVSGAPLIIAGQVNPLAGNLFLNINASVRGVDLPPLSPYFAKYAGYEIEGGKLSFEVSYQVENRQLAAQNRLILDQLVLGEKVESDRAPNLPVQLAVTLLKDRNGVIDVNVPISGSLNDPEFSLGSVLVRAIVNLIAKAITAPFSILASMHGGEELSSLEFDAGSRMIPEKGKAKLESIAKVLGERPKLKLEITGRTDPVGDRDGLGRVGIQRKVRALKRQDMEKQGQSVDYASVRVRPDEYPALLKRVYEAEKFDKPRNLIGLQKNLPVEEMERLMIANYQVDEDDLVNLANQRALAVKDWLTTNGQVSADRIYVLAGKSGSDQKSASRVDFSLR